MSEIYTLPEDSLSQYIISDEQRTAYRGLIADYLLNFTDVFRVKSGVIQSANFVTGSAGWQLNAQGNIEANNGTFRGTLSSTSGTIGGWTIASTSLSGGNATLSSTGVLTLGTSNDVFIASAADSTYRLWIGNSTAASAPIRITKAGAITCSDITITGGTFVGTSASVVEDQATSLYRQIVFLGSKTDGLTATASGGTSSITRYFLNTYLSIPNATTGTVGLSTGSLGVTTGAGAIGWSDGTKFTFSSAGQVLSGLNGSDCSMYQGIYDSSAGTLSGTSITTRHILFIIYNSGLYASCADGTTQNISSAIGGVTLSSKNSFRIVYIPGSSAKFYVNETLVATLSTNLPSGTTNPPNLYMIMRSTSGNGGTFLLNNNYSLVWVP